MLVEQFTRWTPVDPRCRQEYVQLCDIAGTMRCTCEYNSKYEAADCRSPHVISALGVSQLLVWFNLPRSYHRVPPC